MPSEQRLQALLHESANVHDSIQRLYTAIYAGFGAVLPALIGVFLVVANHDGGATLDTPAVALIFLGSYSLGSLWLQILWLELFEYVEYRYTVLYPLLYKASGQENRVSFLEFSLPRHPVAWIPTFLFQVTGLVFVAWVWLRYLAYAGCTFGAIGALFIALPVVGGAIVHSRTMRLQRIAARHSKRSDAEHL